MAPPNFNVSIDVGLCSSFVIANGGAPSDLWLAGFFAPHF
jgi:hypothetical protein